ncbi:hypothetical protein ACFOKI_03710 [Sphingomonas qilianensis]|uniref:Fe-S oxidoreductase n=1 Tax=Sphingomonas qilianensis TaxID=1736690 RepID=A0ABU9XV20_9SPHN
MKIMLIAALAFAAPAFAQTTPPAADPAMQAPATDPAMPAAPADPAMPAPATSTTTTMTMGAPTVTPAPAPKESYPRCSKTVTDGCIQRGGK